MTLEMKTRLKIKLLELNLSLAALFLLAGSAWAGSPAIPAGSTPVANGVAPAASQQPAGFMAFMPFLLMFGVLYFLILRPQQKKLKEQQQMLTSLKHGDEIVTASGILGKVAGITDKVVTVEVADNVKVKMLKSQVSQVIKGSVKDLA